MPDIVNALVRLSPDRRRFARSCKRILQIILVSDDKLYTAARPRPFLPIFPQDDEALLAAVQLVMDRCTTVLNPERS